MLNILVVADVAKRQHKTRPELAIYKNLARLGHRVSIFTSQSDYENELIELGISVNETRQKGKISIKTIRQIRKALKEGDYDIIYASNSRNIPSAAFAAIGTSAKLVCYRGTTRGLYRHDITSYLTLLHPRVDGVVCVSNAVEESVQRQLWKKKIKTTTIFKGHELGWYSEPAIERKTLGIPDDAFVVIAVARFRPSKGLHILLAAASQLKQHSNIHFLIVGSGADTAANRELISDELENRVHFAGFRTDALQLIASSNVLVQCSIDGEGLPRSVIESMAQGVPVISTTSGGAKEIINDGEHGFIVPVKDADAIAGKINQLYQCPGLLEDMSRNCVEIVRNKLSADITAKKHIEFFNSLLAD